MIKVDSRYYTTANSVDGLHYCLADDAAKIMVSDWDEESQEEFERPATVRELWLARANAVLSRTGLKIDGVAPALDIQNNIIILQWVDHEGGLMPLNPLCYGELIGLANQLQSMAYGLVGQEGYRALELKGSIIYQASESGSWNHHAASLIFDHRRIA